MQKIGKWFYQDLPNVLSTNDSVQELLQSVKSPCIVSAAVQTKGRGRLGRTWQEASGNLFVSFAYHIDSQNVGHYALMSALAVLNTLRSYIPRESVQIKWPNDVFVGPKKISGILFEKSIEDFWIMGIGINVAQTPKVQNPMYEITSLADFGVQADRLDVLQKLIAEFDALDALYQKQGFSIIKSLWLDNACRRDKNITVKQNGQTLTGVLYGLDDHAGLIIQTKEGLKTIYAGDIFFEDIKDNHDKF